MTSAVFISTNIEGIRITEQESNSEIYMQAATDGELAFDFIVPFPLPNAMSMACLACWRGMADTDVG